MKVRQLQDLLHQIGLSKEEVTNFGLRSFRSGGAGQAIVNLTSQCGGVPKSFHYQAIARMLGHSSLTRVTLESYTGPLGNLIFDNSAVIFEEEEGAVGGDPDLEARMARLPQYMKFAPGTVSKEERAKKSEERAIAHLPKLPPGLAVLVEAHPAVVAAHKARAGVEDACGRAAWREQLIFDASKGDASKGEASGGDNMPPGLCAVLPEKEGRGVGDSVSATDELFAKLEVVNKNHTNIRRKSLLRIASNSEAKRDAHAPGLLALRFSPDILLKTVNILQEYHQERESFGMSHIFIVYPGSSSPHNFPDCRNNGPVCGQICTKCLLP